jgi:hypothetical protein
MKHTNDKNHTVTIPAADYSEYCKLKAADNNYVQKLAKAQRKFDFEVEKLKNDKTLYVDISHNHPTVWGGRPETQYHLSIAKNSSDDIKKVEEFVKTLIDPVISENRELKARIDSMGVPHPILEAAKKVDEGYVQDNTLGHIIIGTALGIALSMFVSYLASTI